MHSCTDNLELLIKVTTMARMQSHTEIVRFVMNFSLCNYSYSFAWFLQFLLTPSLRGFHYSYSHSVRRQVLQVLYNAQNYTLIF